MRNLASPAALTLSIILIASPAFAAKINGSTTLKDVQPTGTTDKEHKHQAYDLSFSDKGKGYTCRTDSDKSMNATDFVVGTQIKYEVNGNKGKIETPEGKKVECKIVRVEASPATP
jgi:gentisate 1,2-dioxygenase